MTCILDPALVLSSYGIRLVQQLGTVLELWIAREFWPFTQQEALWTALDSASPARPPATVRDGAKSWRTLQDHIAPSDLRLYWYGDRLWESHLPAAHPPAAFYQWEALAESLDSCLPMQSWDSSLLRDTLALAATLPNGFILTYQPQPEQPPPLCMLMESAQLPCEKLPDHNALVQLHRQTLQNYLLQTGLAFLLWGNSRLAILQLGVCDAIAVPALLTKQYSTKSEMSTTTIGAAAGLTSLLPLWLINSGFWYSLYG
jgi:hypothetical protein